MSDEELEFQRGQARTILIFVGNDVAEASSGYFEADPWRKPKGTHSNPAIYEATSALRSFCTDLGVDSLAPPRIEHLTLDELKEFTQAWHILGAAVSPTASLPLEVAPGTWLDYYEKIQAFNKETQVAESRYYELLSGGMTSEKQISNLRDMGPEEWHLAVRLPLTNDDPYVALDDEVAVCASEVLEWITSQEYCEQCTALFAYQWLICWSCLSQLEEDSSIWSVLKEIRRRLNDDGYRKNHTGPDIDFGTAFDEFESLSQELDLGKDWLSEWGLDSKVLKSYK